MADHYSLCGAWAAEDDIIPADLVAELPPNSDRRLFFMRMTVEFKSPNHPTRKVKELSVPVDEDKGLTREAWELINSGLNQMGSPASAIPEGVLQLICCAIQMLKDPANVGRFVLPMELLVTYDDEEQEKVAVVKEEKEA
ncbi:hypothetical protein Hanom_Chr09g00839461 [Helianthus anomalus]